MPRQCCCSGCQLLLTAAAGLQRHTHEYSWMADLRLSSLMPHSECTRWPPRYSMKVGVTLTSMSIMSFLVAGVSSPYMLRKSHSVCFSASRW